MINAQAPDVSIPPKKHIVDIGNHLQPSLNKKGKWGFVDPKGKYYIKPVFDEVTAFKHKIPNQRLYIASVKYGDKWRIIKDNGEYYPNAQTEFDIEPTFEGIYVFYVSNGQLYRQNLSAWGKGIKYEKKIFKDKTVYLPEKEGVLNPIYIVYSNGNKRESHNYHLNAITNEGSHILKIGTEYNLVDKEFNEITDPYAYMQGNGQMVVAINRDGKGIVYNNNTIYDYKCESSHIACRSQVEYIINNERLLNILNGCQNTTLWCDNTKNNLYHIKQNDKFGLIDVSSELYIPIIYDEQINLARGRYATNTEDVIFCDGTMYTIPDYESLIYKKSNIIKDHRYDISAQIYLADSLLTKEEKTHYNEVADSFEKWSNETSEFDDILFAKYSPEEYITTRDIPEEFKKHLARAQKAIENREQLLSPNREIKWRAPHSYESEILYSWERTQESNGNYYTHKFFQCNDLTFRVNAITNKTEVLFNGIYIPIDKSRKFYDYGYITEIDLANEKHLEFYTDLAYSYKKEHRRRHDQWDGILLHRGLNENPVNMIIFDALKNYKISSVAFSTKNLTLREGYCFGKYFAKRRDGCDKYGPNPDYDKIRSSIHARGYTSPDDCLYESDWDFEPIENRVEDEDDKALMTVLYIYDYNLDFPKIYASKEGEFIHDIFKWGNKWIFVGSTINKGYIDWENPYIVILDSKLKVITSSSLPLKGHRLTVNKQTIYEDANKALVIPGWVKIKPNNTIEWLE